MILSINSDSVPNDKKSTNFSSEQAVWDNWYSHSSTYEDSRRMEYDAVCTDKQINTILTICTTKQLCLLY
jgi:hypothetical protein